MAIFEFGEKKISKVEQTTFGRAGLKERADLQRLLRDQIEIVAEGVLVISEEFGEWTDGRRRIDLLGVDRDANLVVLELKRTEDGGHMELQALRYAAMVSTLTAARAVEIFSSYLIQRGKKDDAEQQLLGFLGWQELDEDAFGQEVRIVLVSADFSRELTTAVMWLNDKDLDIRCTRIRPYEYAGKTLIDVQQVIPLPEAADYQVEVREKKRVERQARKEGRDTRKYDIKFAGSHHRRESKRNAIWLLVQNMVGDGITPEQIDQAIEPVRPRGAWYSIEGDVRESDDFIDAAAEQAETLGYGYAFSPGRWCSGEDEVVVAGDRSYVFTKMWGAQWAGTLELIAKRWPELGLRWWPSDEMEPE